MQQRRNSWQDGVYGTNCPIPPGQNFTYVLQVKDQIGSYFYFPSLAFHKAAGGYGGIKISSRPLIPVPFPPPAGDYTVLAGDWYKKNHTVRSIHPLHIHWSCWKTSLCDNPWNFPGMFDRIWGQFWMVEVIFLSLMGSLSMAGLQMDSHFLLTKVNYFYMLEPWIYIWGSSACTIC